MLGQMAQNGDTYAQAHARRMVDLAAYIAQASPLLAEAQWELDNEWPTHKPDVTTYFINQHLKSDYDPMLDNGYTQRLEHLMTAL
jgi:hypothetical protein